MFRLSQNQVDAAFRIIEQVLQDFAVNGDKLSGLALVEALDRECFDPQLVDAYLAYDRHVARRHRHRYIHTLDGERTDC